MMLLPRIDQLTCLLLKRLTRVCDSVHVSSDGIYSKYQYSPGTLSVWDYFTGLSLRWWCVETPQLNRVHWSRSIFRSGGREEVLFILFVLFVFIDLLVVSIFLILCVACVANTKIPDFLVRNWCCCETMPTVCKVQRCVDTKKIALRTQNTRWSWSSSWD